MEQVAHKPYVLKYPTLVAQYQLDINAIPLMMKSMMEETKKSLYNYEKLPTLANRNKVSFNDEILCKSINNWVDEICKVLED